MINVPEITERNGLESPEDYLHATRMLSRVPRGHTLGYNKPLSIAEHMLNCVYLLDFLIAQDKILPKVSTVEVLQVKEYLLYHDCHECLVGDIPYYVSKTIEGEGAVRREILKHFHKDIELDPKLYTLAKQIDMLEFMLDVITDSSFHSNCFVGHRLRTAFDNGVEFMAEGMHYHSIQWDCLFKGYKKNDDR